MLATIKRLVRIVLAIFFPAAGFLHFLMDTATSAVDGLLGEPTS